jgi:hypothetical protein
MKMKQQKLYNYHVTLDIPNSQQTHDEVDVENVPNQFEAKCAASKKFFDHLFTGTFKYMKAERVTAEDYTVSNSASGHRHFPHEEEYSDQPDSLERPGY